MPEKDVPKYDDTTPRYPGDFRVKEIADVLFDRLYELMQIKSKRIPHWIYFEGRLTDSAGNMIYDFNWTNTSVGQYQINQDPFNPDKLVHPLSDNEFRYGKYEPYWKNYKSLKKQGNFCNYRIIYTC